MKRYLGVCLAALLLLSGCGQQAAEPADDTPSADTSVEAAEPLTLERLTVELPRGELETETLAAAVRLLPDALRQALADRGVEVDEIRVTVGASSAASLQAVEDGGVDLAFLPAADAAQQGALSPALASGPLTPDQGEDPADWDRAPTEAPPVTGYRGLLCAAPTEYGQNLAGRASLTWDELDHARWGVLDADSLLGAQAVSLWLADHYDGNTLSDLSDVTEYPDTEALLRAAAKGEIDVFPVDAADRAETWADVWQLPTDATDGSGRTGLGRSASIWEETPVLALTDRFYDMATVVGDGDVLAGDRFLTALASAVNDLRASPDADVRRLAQATLGDYDYAVAPEGALAATARLQTLP